MYRLGTKINYENEKQCLHGILRQIALLYVPEPFEEDENADGGGGVVKNQREHLQHELENVLFP